MTYELFNAHQEDNRKRTEFLAKSVFLISGGTLSLSMSMFLGKDAPTLIEHLSSLLRVGWMTLFISMVGYILVISVMIIRDYIHGEQWRKVLDGKLKATDDLPSISDIIIWLLGIGSIISFITGMALVAYVAGCLLP